MSWIDSIFKPQSSNKIELETEGKKKKTEKEEEIESKEYINEKKRKEGQKQG